MVYLSILLLLIFVCTIMFTYVKIIYGWKRKIKIISSIHQYNNFNNNNIRDNKYTNNKFEEVSLTQAPGPAPWPILGNLALLGQYEVPFQGFTELSKKYGDIYTLTLGETRCLIVSNIELIREVLNQNGKFFGGRPDFIRFHKLFGGDRNNSLALCDFTVLQQRRRNLARKHCSPGDGTSFFTKMSDAGCIEISLFMDHIKENNLIDKEFHIKPLIQQICANMFLQYMCSTRFDYTDKEFMEIVDFYDEIFWEINQGYAVDFLPWLEPFYYKHLRKLVHWSTTIRKFILKQIIDKRQTQLDAGDVENDFTDALLKSFSQDPTISRDTILYMLEDFIGGHSAIGNLVMLAFGYMIRYPEVSRKIQDEIDLIMTEMSGETEIHMKHMGNMPYTLATIYEILRHSSSPIVPHVATEDTCIAGYGVTKGTMVFINNYELNTGEKYWDKPAEFKPERFMETISKDQLLVTSGELIRDNTDNDNVFQLTVGNVNMKKSPSAATTTTTTTTAAKIPNNNENVEMITRLKKNIPHFLPFSIGKRTCIGQNLVRGYTFLILTNILKTYNVTCSDVNLIKMFPACVALPSKTFPLKFTKRYN